MAQTITFLLVNSLNVDSNVRNDAMTSLAAKRKEHNFFAEMAEIACDGSVEVSIRLSSAVYLKNIAVDYPEILKTVKDDVLSLLFRGIDPGTQIGRMICMAYTKIAAARRGSQFSSDVTAHLKRVLYRRNQIKILMIIHQSLKDGDVGKQITSDLFDSCWALWQKNYKRYEHRYYIPDAPNADSLYPPCELYLLATKVMRRLVVVDSEHFPVPEEENLHLMFKAMCSHTETAVDRSKKIRDFPMTLSILLMKTLIAAQSLRPYSFGMKTLVRVLSRRPYRVGTGTLLRLLLNYCCGKFNDTNMCLKSFEEYFIQCMLLLKAIFECKEYKPSWTDPMLDEECMKAIQCDVAKVRGWFFEILIKRCMVLSASDLEKWEQSPEAFYRQEDALLWSENLRLCAEALLRALLENRSEILHQYLTGLISKAMEETCLDYDGDEITPSLLTMDAIFTAVAISADLQPHSLHRLWLEAEVEAIMKNKQPYQKAIAKKTKMPKRIIQRKAALIFGNWATKVNGGFRSRDQLEEGLNALKNMLITSEDMCVKVNSIICFYLVMIDIVSCFQLTAVKALRMHEVELPVGFKLPRRFDPLFDLSE